MIAHAHWSHKSIYSSSSMSYHFTYSLLNGSIYTMLVCGPDRKNPWPKMCCARAHAQSGDPIIFVHTEFFWIFHVVHELIHMYLTRRATYWAQWLCEVCVCVSASKCDRDLDQKNCADNFLHNHKIKCKGNSNRKREATWSIQRQLINREKSVCVFVCYTCLNAPNKFKKKNADFRHFATHWPKLLELSW